MTWNQHYKWYNDEYDKNSGVKHDDTGVVGNIFAPFGLTRPSNSVVGGISNGFFKYVAFPVAAAIDSVSGTPLRDSGPPAISESRGPQIVGKRMPRRNKGNKNQMPGKKNNRQSGSNGGRPRNDPRYNVRGSDKDQGWLMYERNWLNRQVPYTPGFSNLKMPYDPITRARRLPYLGRNPGRELRAQYSRNQRGKPRPFYTPPVRGNFYTRGTAFINPTRTTGMDYNVTKRSPLTSRITAKVYLGSVYRMGDNKVQWFIEGNNIGGQYYFNPATPYYAGSDNAVYRTAVNFERYRIISGEMKFTPRSSAYSHPDWVVNALLTPSVDYYRRLNGSHFVGNPGTPDANDTPISSTILQNPAACQVAAWDRGFTCPMPRTPWLWCTTIDGSGPFLFTDNAALQRQAYAFSFGIIVDGSGGDPTDSFAAFEAWYMVEIEFKDQLPFGVNPLVRAPKGYPDRKLIVPFEKMSIKDDSKIKEESKHKAINTKKSNSEKILKKLESSNPGETSHKSSTATTARSVRDGESDAEEEFVIEGLRKHFANSARE